MAARLAEKSESERARAQDRGEPACALAGLEGRQKPRPAVFDMGPQYINMYYLLRRPPAAGGVWRCKCGLHTSALRVPRGMPQGVPVRGNGWLALA